MTDETPDSAPEPTYPAFNFPTVFSDGVSNMAWSGQFVKFFLSRMEPSVNVVGAPAQQRAIAQVVMPMDGFLATFVFFEYIISSLIRDGVITEEHLNNLRSLQTSGRPSGD
jgi:hypothetical protein